MEIKIDLGWNAIKDVIGWVASAMQAAKTKSERRVVNIVEHAGILTAGVNRLNGQVVALLEPLRYFDPSEWDAKSRAQLSRHLILFAKENVVVPRMRAARSSLQILLTDIDDPDVSLPARDVLDMADRLFNDYNLDYHPDWREDIGEAGALFDHVYDGQYMPDAYLTAVLPKLLKMIRSAKDSKNVTDLQAMATELTMVDSRDTLGSTTSEWNSDVMRIMDSLPARSVLAPYAAGMQVAFGRLIAAQQRIFPALPSPSWAF